MSPLIAILTVFVFWLGPPIAATIAGALFFKARRGVNPQNPLPWNDYWTAAFGSGVAAAGIWIGLVALLLIVTRSGNTGLWMVLVPWAFAAGEVYGVYRLAKRLHGG